MKYINTLIEHFKSLLRQDKENKHTLKDDLKTFLDKYKGDFKTFIKESKHCKLLNEFNKLSPKMVYMIFKSIKSKGPVVLYSNYVLMEG